MSGSLDRRRWPSAIAVLVAVGCAVAACAAPAPPDMATLERVQLDEQVDTAPLLVPQDVAPPPAQALPLAAVPPPPPSAPEPASDPAPDPAPSEEAPEPQDDPGDAPAACDVGDAAGAEQVVVVEGSGSRATVTACAQDAGGYVAELGPFRGHVGRAGVAPPGAKREGDGRTPAGVFPLREGFGSRADPGLAQGWSVVDAADVWVDDPGSALYNTRQRDPADGRWASAERLLTEPAYSYAQVIGYNEDATPGAGSAIFLHVSTGGATAGCVSLPSAELLQVLRWERPGAVMVVR